MMGFRLSAEKVLGMLTLGEENTGTPNGINSLSGYMKIIKQPLLLAVPR